MTNQVSAPTPSASYTRIALTWAVLVAITLTSWGESDHAKVTWVAAGLLILTAFKVVVVMRTFMEIARAPLWLQGIAYAWITAVTALIAIFTLV